MVGKDSRGEKFEKKPFKAFLIDHEEDPDCRSPEDDDIISTPHSNSFLDLNGDCMPDIFLQKTGVVSKAKGSGGTAYHNYYEIYTQRQSHG